ncbi:flagellar filament capping protein FliD [Blastococcus sp. PRF04-17]|uniref:flagellar filament capping protein FliD n=1 Tax=Blastococcus sp. PRF04-17 TaxID=2933797 RepID=UPI001FF4CD9A|nr:flagellar filament capping protein FliD [Blastococcus sp. PRF04-17]UOY03911.1 flagellar filament capping protein FliD [Blastococcus sp. PRF04-17]
MSVDGLISGMDTTSLINQLLKAEAGTQTSLKTRLSATQLAASAYRTVNTTIAAVRAAAEALTTTAVTAGRKATTDSSAVTASATTSAAAGTALTFTPSALAATHTVLSNSQWTTTTGSVRDQEPAWPIQIRKADGTTVVGTIDVPPSASLADAVTAINATDFGVKATIVSLSPTEHRLQLVSTASGEAGRFIVKSATESEEAAGSGFTALRTGADATLDFGNGVQARSASNTFADLMPGVSVTISKVDGSAVTVSVAADSEAVATKMQTLVDAVNSALTTIRTYTSSAPGSTAALKGEYAVTSIAGQILDAASKAVGADGSPAKLGLELTKDGKVTFDRAKFGTALKDDPALVQRMVVGTVASNGPDGVVGGTDDVAAVPGLVARLLDVAKAASDSTTGSLVNLANGQDSLAKDYTARIADWDLRLAKRKETLTRQFTAMETALSSLKNQSTWLAGQINAMPSRS